MRRPSLLRAPPHGPGLPRLDDRVLLRRWPGLDASFHEVVTRLSASAATRRFRRELAVDLARVRGKVSPFGEPERVERAAADRIRAFVPVYHRALATIIAASVSDAEVREALALPADLSEELDGDVHPESGRVHLCRLDLLLDPAGGFRVLETNANCPGALLSCGMAARRWREHLASRGIDVPPPSDFETPNWMARWFLEAARSDTRHPVERVALLRERGGNRLELPGLSRQLAAEGVDAFEADPREARLSRTGVPSLRGAAFRHAYLKLRIQRLRRMRPAVTGFLEALRRRDLFVQNGIRGRLVGDNKLVLAILSDPRFAYLFDPADLASLQPHIPWSRRVWALSRSESRQVREHRELFVLKSPLDTQGRGVVIGREVRTRTAWERTLERAVAERWLVQEFCSTTRLSAEDGRPRIHDLSVGVVGGRLAGAVIRSSLELRTNVARTGRLHPVFLDG